MCVGGVWWGGGEEKLAGEGVGELLAVQGREVWGKVQCVGREKCRVLPGVWGRAKGEGVAGEKGKCQNKWGGRGE